MTLDALRAVEAFTDSRSIRELQGGEILYRPGDRGEHLYGLLDGEIELREVDGLSAERIEPGQVFGAAALAISDHRRQVTALAVTPSRLLELGRQEFLFALQETPMFALALIAGLEQRLEQAKRHAGRS